MKNKIKMYLTCLLIALVFSPSINVQSQVAYEVDNKGDLVLYDEEIAYLNRELSRRQAQERRELEDKFQKEEGGLLERLNKQERDLGKRLDEEKVELIERIRREREDFKRRQEEEKTSLLDKHREQVQREIEDRKVYRTYKKNSNTGFAENRKEHKLTLKERIDKRIKEIQVAARRIRHVDVITDADDPIYIEEAYIEKAKTDFLSVENVDIIYKVILINQTPKIINLASLEWERTEPFSNTNSTIDRTTKIHDPLVPYERREIAYNELDGNRNGEYYTIKVAQVVFEDGTQWKNPVITKKF